MQVSRPKPWQASRMAGKGGRIPPDGRPPQAKGVGKNAKRHDMERPKTPGLHNSDLQQGDVQAMEQGQRIAPASTQQPAGPSASQTQQTPNRATSGVSGVEVPDAIEFLAGRNGQGFNVPNPQRQLDSSRALTWLPIIRQLVSGPGTSSALVNAFINQARLMQQAGGQPATIVDMRATDDGLEAMLDVGVMGPEPEAEAEPESSPEPEAQPEEDY